MAEVLSYTKTGNHVSVKGYHTCPLPEECIINGVILDGTPIIQGLNALKSSQPGLFNDVSLIIDGSFVYTKRITVPGKMNKWMHIQVIRDEFAEIATDAENLLCEYIPLSNNPDGSKQILACAVEKSHVDNYISIMKSAGIEVKKVRLGIQAILRYISNKPELKQLPFVLNLVDGEILISMIFQNGVSVFQSRTRLFGEDRATLVQNTLDGLSGIIQFNKSQNFDDIKNCCYIGLSDTDMDLINVNNPYPDIDFSIIDLFKGVKGSEILPPNAHITYLNTLIPDSEPDLLQKIKELDKIKKRNKPKKIWIPILAGLVAILMIAVVLLWMSVLRIERDVRDLNTYMNSPKVLAEKEELAYLNADTTAINNSHDNINRQITTNDARPVLSRNQIDTIMQTGGDNISVNSFTFSDKDGKINLNASALTEFDASTYVDRLRANALIDNVEYLGYSSTSANLFGFSIAVKPH